MDTGYTLPRPIPGQRPQIPKPPQNKVTAVRSTEWGRFQSLRINDLELVDLNSRGQEDRRQHLAAVGMLPVQMREPLGALDALGKQVP
jgi:hypothetical protein